MASCGDIRLNIAAVEMGRARYQITDPTAPPHARATNRSSNWALSLRSTKAVSHAARLHATVTAAAERVDSHSRMYGFKSLISSRKPASVSDWAPSLTAFSGHGWTSTISPSAPMATPARDTAGTRLRLPVAWLGSRITGRWV